MVEVSDSQDLFFPSLDHSINDTILVTELKRLFSLENLEKDYSLIMNMDGDLWVPLGFLWNLESIKTICHKQHELIPACYHAGLEVCGEFVRKLPEIPRKKVYVRNCQALKHDLQGITVKYMEQEGNTMLLYFENEKDALSAIKIMQDHGMNCGIDYIEPVTYLAKCSWEYITEHCFGAVSELFFNRRAKGKEYSLEEIKGIYSKMTPQLPKNLEKWVKVGIIRGSPRSFVTLTN